MYEFYRLNQLAYIALEIMVMMVKLSGYIVLAITELSFVKINLSWLSFKMRLVSMVTNDPDSQAIVKKSIRLIKESKIILVAVRKQLLKDYLKTIKLDFKRD